MTKIFFAHANGFPSATYACLHQHLSADHIDYIDVLGVGKYQITKNWYPLVDEVLETITQKYNKPVVALGHSLGAYIFLYAAQRRPELFSKVIMMDPPVFRPTKRWGLELLNQLNLIDKTPHPSAKAKVRRYQFGSQEEAYHYFHNKALFRHFDETCFEAYIAHALVPNKKGFTLRIPRELEYRVFRTMPVFLNNPQKYDNYHFIHSASHEVNRPADIKWLKKRIPKAQFHLQPGTHMFPFESPKETAELINSLL